MENINVEYKDNKLIFTGVSEDCATAILRTAVKEIYDEAEYYMSKMQLTISGIKGFDVYLQNLCNQVKIKNCIKTENQLDDFYRQNRDAINEAGSVPNIVLCCRGIIMEERYEVVKYGSVPWLER